MKPNEYNRDSHGSPDSSRRPFCRSHVVSRALPTSSTAGRLACFSPSAFPHFFLLGRPATSRSHSSFLAVVGHGITGRRVPRFCRAVSPRVGCVQPHPHRASVSGAAFGSGCLPQLLRRTNSVFRFSRSLFAPMIPIAATPNHALQPTGAAVTLAAILRSNPSRPSHILS